MLLDSFTIWQWPYLWIICLTNLVLSCQKYLLKLLQKVHCSLKWHLHVDYIHNHFPLIRPSHYQILNINTSCSWPPTFGTESRRLNTKNIPPTLCMEIWAWFRTNVFCSWFPIFDAKSKKLRAKTIPWPHFEFLNFVLGVLSMAKIKIFCSWPPTFGIESKKPNTKTNCSNSMHAYLGMV